MPETQRGKMNVWAVIMAVVVAALSALGIMLAQGTVPLPTELMWAVPIFTAAITALVAAFSPQLKL